MILRNTVPSIFILLLFSLTLLAQQQKYENAGSVFGYREIHYNKPPQEKWESISSGKEAGFNRLLKGRSSGSQMLNVSGEDSSDVILQHGFSKAIEDNSFFIEEAYNQEERIVQHISNVVYFSQPLRDVVYTFTQEWPIGGQRHQLSLTIPYAFLNSNTINGISDLMLNYRYQLFTSNDWAAVAPRISIVLPTGNVNKNLGLGTAGVQVNLPASKRLSDFFVAHLNIGFTYLPAAQAPNTINGFQADKHKLTWYNFGGSIIWLAGKKLNFMLEYLMNSASEIDELGNVNRFTEKYINPGIRYAIDIGDLQIVPGLGFPFSFSSRQAGTRVGMIFYLSFEHPF